jgi:hypothetical protein
MLVAVVRDGGEWESQGRWRVGLGKLCVVIESVVQLLFKALRRGDLRLGLNRDVDAEGGRVLGGVEAGRTAILGGRNLLLHGATLRRALLLLGC